MADYVIRSVPVMDTYAAYMCEADRAEGEGFHGVAKRQREVALHLRNAFDRMQELRPEGHRVDMNIVFTFTPSVNPVARRD